MNCSAMPAGGVVVVIPVVVPTTDNQRRVKSRSHVRHSQTMSTPRTSRGVVRPCVPRCSLPDLRRTVWRESQLRSIFPHDKAAGTICSPMNNPALTALGAIYLVYGRPTMHYTTDFLMETYRRMVRIRLFETSMFESQDIPTVGHTSVGMEGSIVGACMALHASDYIVGTHRSHGHPIGKGADVRRLAAELLGGETGVDKGKGGSMHLSDFSVGSLGETSIVGSGLPVATGAGLAIKVWDG